MCLQNFVMAKTDINQQTLHEKVGAKGTQLHEISGIRCEGQKVF